MHTSYFCPDPMATTELIGKFMMVELHNQLLFLRSGTLGQWHKCALRGGEPIKQ